MHWRFPPTDEPSIGYDCRIFCIRNGRATLHCEGVHDMPTGSVAFIGTEVPYRFERAESEPFGLFVINFDLTDAHTDIDHFVSPDHPADFDPARIVEKCELDEGFRTIVLPGATHLAKLAREIYNEHHAAAVYAGRRMSAMLTDLLILMWREASVPNTRTARLVSDIKRCIHENYMTPFTNEQLGEMLGYHPLYLARIFREVTGMTLHKYLLDVRMMEAAAQLHATDASIESIAEACGFATASHFTQAYKKHYGVLPSEARR